MDKIKALILKNEDPFDHLPWVKACESYNDKITCKVVDLTCYNWLEQILQFGPDVCLLKPAGKTSLFRSLYYERVDIISNDLGIYVFPSYNETRIYESKRFLAYWLSAKVLPHPRTWVHYSKKDAIHFASQVELPVVGKINIGASGNGVQIIKTRAELNSYINMAFNSGLVTRTGPKLNKGMLLKRLLNALFHPDILVNRLKTYKSISTDKQLGYVILQEFIPHDFEWRVVRIGDSFFAHKKLKVGDKTSGSLIKDYGNPPMDLLGFVKDLTDQAGFLSVAVDLFFDVKGNYLINEIQCIFGQSDEYQMLVDGEQGRYTFNNGQWKFEKGDFAMNACYNLRVEHVIKYLTGYDN